MYKVKLLIAFLVCNAFTALAEGYQIKYHLEEKAYDLSGDVKLHQAIWEMFESSNFQFPLNQKQKHRDLYHSTIQSNHIRITYSEPVFMSIAKNRNTVSDFWVLELIFSMNPTMQYARNLFIMKKDGTIIEMGKYNGAHGINVANLIHQKAIQ